MLSTMAQPDPVYLPTRPRAHGRPRPVPYAAPTVDLNAEYQFWQAYERLVRPLPGGGLRLAWLVFRNVYRARERFPDDTHEAALARVLFGSNMTAQRAAELQDLYGLVSRRLATVAARAPRP
ncbi:hypothetical protein [Stenotrophomonas cyclobalanopsidis]|uniref:hypothetical protein n=1 Tax=Stenotrophomonas cyclobalanopsidis TaxID=2771362 RepID=UPI0028A9F25C|nr:hypothetical protein [Stenotrophomonas cyclobalanopsidis]